MLRAINKETGLSVHAEDINDSDKSSWKGKIICPFTHTDLIFVSQFSRNLKVGKTDVSAHFRHKSKFVEIPEYILYDGDYFRQKENKYYLNESAEHHLGKQKIKQHCQGLYYSWHSESKVDIQFEYVVKLSTGRWRIADVAVISPCGFIDVHEVQLCKISPEELEERTNDYFSEGISRVFWYFGKSASTDANREWHYEYFRSVAQELEFEDIQDM